MNSVPSVRPASFSVNPLSSVLGARVLGVDLSTALDDRTFAMIEDALHRYGVLVFPDQKISDAEQKAFSLRFGSELDIHPLLQFAKPDNPEVFVLSNIKVDGKPIGASDAAQYWHTDLSYMSHPSRVSLLHAIEVPHDGATPLGDTEFASTVLAYRDLPEAIQTRLAGKRASHLAQKPKKSQSSHFVKPLASDTEARLKEVMHPVVRIHPYTGEKCLYVNEGFTVAIEGMPRPESDELLEFLFHHMTQPKYLYAHKWSVGDVVVWDNCLTIHQGVPNYGPHQRRLMYRTIVKGTAPY